MSRNEIIPYDPELKSVARMLRKNMTSAEVYLWSNLRRQQLGYKFHRQTPMLNYVVDFYCYELKLVIEVDGGLHDHPEVSVNDLKRQHKIEAYGVHFLRFDNKEIKTDINKVIQTIKSWIRLNE
ncbi:MAG TPA: endonuclease domain-containing protein [Fodinibius sp.]|nr:endonuclease domain-containing protein [Fodinibius sp.]